MRNLKEFKAAYFSDISDAECIKLISDDPKVVKLQLQIALGVSMDYSGRMVHKHQNHRIDLQRALLSKIDDSVFLSDVLRDFIIRPCDDGQVPVPDADITTRLLLDAGADPYVTEISENYQSPGLEFISRSNTQTTFDLAAKCYCYLDHPLMKELLQEPEKENRFTQKSLLYILVYRIHVLDHWNEHPTTDFFQQIQDTEWIETTYFFIDELIKSGITTTELTTVLNELIAEHPHGYSEYVCKQYRWVESVMLQSIYDRDIDTLACYAWLAKACLILSPLIIPLFIAAVIGIIYLVTKQSMKVKIEDISINQFMTSYLDDEQKFFKISEKHEKSPIIQSESGPRLRTAIVFNTDTLEKKLTTDSISKFSAIFNGNSSMVLRPESPEIDGDVRVYEVRG